MLKRRVMTGLVMLLLTSLAQADDGRPPMPAMTVDLNKISYPDAARKSELQGRVLVSFSISKKGRVDDELIVESEPIEVFDKAALELVKKIKFAVPDNWEDLAGPLQRYRLSVVFKLYPCPEPCVPPKRHEDADDFVIVSAQIR